MLFLRCRLDATCRLLFESGLPTPVRQIRAKYGWVLVLASLLPASARPETNPASQTGSIDGRLTDWNSVPLEHAEVVVRNVANGALAHVVTGKNGSYHLTGLRPGEYSIEADIPQLGKGQVDGILISAGHATRVQAALVLELPQADLPQEPVTPPLDPLQPAVSTLIPADELNALPLAQRDWRAIAATTTAANPAPALGSGAPDGSDEEVFGQLLSMRGGDPDMLSESIDGMPAAGGFQTPGSSGRSLGRDAQPIGPSAVMQVEARAGNANADAADASGGAMNFTTGHGGNELHGQAFYLNRQNLWGAKNPFTQWTQQSAPATVTTIPVFTPQPFTPENNQQSFGFGIGSRIKRDKLFWFAALDGLFRNDPAVASVRHPENFFAQPTDDELAVLGLRLGATAPDFYEQEIADYSSALTQLDGLLGPAPRSLNQYQGFGRVDWQVSERNHLSAEAGVTHADAPGGALGRSSETYGSSSFADAQANESWAMARLESFVTPNLLNSAAVEFRRNLQSEFAHAPSAFESALLANPTGQLPEMVADSKYGFILGTPAGNYGKNHPDERLLAAEDTVNWVHGAHLVKAGASFDHISDITDTLYNQDGTYSYADVFNFISDIEAFGLYNFNGYGPYSSAQHYCDATGRVHRSGATVLGLGPLPCYAWYAQRIGPTNWSLTSNNLAAFATEQWQPAPSLTLSAALRVEAEQLPPPIASVANPDPSLHEKLPPASLNWGPRFGIAYAPWGGKYATVLRAGAGIYFSRIDNSVILAALTQTGSPNGDLNFFFRPDDSSAPPFPYVFPVAPPDAVAPGAVSFAPRFHRAAVGQAVVSLEQELPSHWLLSVNGLASLGRHLPISVDTNLAPPVNSAGKPQTITYAVVDAIGAGPIKAAQITVPFYTARTDPTYQQLASIESRANSTYEALMLKVAHSGRSGLNLRAHYLYAHATDWNPNESGQVASNDVLDPADFGLEYGTSNLDIRHSAAVTVLYQTPWKLRDWAGVLANGWSVGAQGQFRSGLPYTMRTSGYIPGFYTSTGGLLEGVATGMNGSGGDNRVYGMGSDNHSYLIGRNTFRYPLTYTADARVGKRFYLRKNRELELLGESFNLFNHQNVTRIETIGYSIRRGTTDGGLPTLNFLTGLTSAGLPSTTPEFGKPLDVNATNYYRPREFQFGLRMRF